MRLQEKIDEGRLAEGYTKLKRLETKGEVKKLKVL